MIDQNSPKTEPGAAEICRKAFAMSWIILFLAIAFAAATLPEIKSKWMLDNFVVILQTLVLILAVTFASHVVAFCTVILRRMKTFRRREIMPFLYADLFFLSVIVFCFKFVTIPFLQHLP